MTNKEAIEILNTLIYAVVSSEEVDALNLAIKALEETQCYQEMQAPKKRRAKKE